MLGSRFDLFATLNDLSMRRDEANGEVPLEELEREIAVVAAKVHTAATRVQFRCPVCEQPMRLDDDEPLSEFDGLGVEFHRLECDACGMLAGRVYHPEIGYDSRLVR